MIVFPADIVPSPHDMVNVSPALYPVTVPETETESMPHFGEELLVDVIAIVQTGAIIAAFPLVGTLPEIVPEQVTFIVPELVSTPCFVVPLAWLSMPIPASVFDTGNVYLNLLLIIALTTVAGILGNTTGYLFGKNIGKTMFQWKDNILFKKKYLHQAHDFYEKHGGGAIVFARFVPIVRTFAPIVAGIVEMDKKKFAFYNILGCIAWVASMILGGHFLQQWILKQFNFDLKQHLEIIVIGIVLVTTAPVIIKLVFGKVKSSLYK